MPGKELAQEHYAEHEGKAFFPKLVDFLSSGAVVAMVWEGGWSPSSNPIPSSPGPNPIPYSPNSIPSSPGSGPGPGPGNQSTGAARPPLKHGLSQHSRLRGHGMFYRWSDLAARLHEAERRRLFPEQAMEWSPPGAR